MSVNKVILIGHLGQDPELRETQGGQAVGGFSLATNERWKSKDGEQQERTEWHRVVVWGKLAEICAKHLRKGASAYVEGSLRTRQWDDKDGNKRYTTEIQAQTVRFLGGKGGATEPRQDGARDSYGSHASDYGPPAVMGDDLPF